MLTNVQKPFYFLRHGQTDWNKACRVQGQTDIPLNETGRVQAHEAAQLLASAPITRIISSPLSRARETAEIIALTINKPMFIRDEFKEAYWGPLEGKVSPAELTDWRKGKYVEGTEPYHEFAVRVARGLNEALSYPGPILIVAHGALYWTVQEILKLPITATHNCTPIYHEPPTTITPFWSACAVEQQATL